MNPRNQIFSKNITNPTEISSTTIHMNGNHNELQIQSNLRTTFIIHSIKSSIAGATLMFIRMELCKLFPDFFKSENILMNFRKDDDGLNVQQVDKSDAIVIILTQDIVNDEHCHLLIDIAIKEEKRIVLVKPIDPEDKKKENDESILKDFITKSFQQKLLKKELIKVTLFSDKQTCAQEIFNLKEAIVKFNTPPTDDANIKLLKEQLQKRNPKIIIDVFNFLIGKVKGEQFERAFSPSSEKYLLLFICDEMKNIIEIDPSLNVLLAALSLFNEVIHPDRKEHFTYLNEFKSDKDYGKLHSSLFPSLIDILILKKENRALQLQGCRTISVLIKSLEKVQVINSMKNLADICQNLLVKAQGVVNYSQPAIDILAQVCVNCGGNITKISSPELLDLVFLPKFEGNKSQIHQFEVLSCFSHPLEPQEKLLISNKILLQVANALNSKTIEERYFLELLKGLDNILFKCPQNCEKFMHISPNIIENLMRICRTIDSSDVHNFAFKVSRSIIIASRATQKDFLPPVLIERIVQDFQKYETNDRLHESGAQCLS